MKYFHKLRDWKCLGVEFIHDPEEKEVHGENVIKAVIRFADGDMGRLNDVCNLITAAPELLSACEKAFTMLMKGKCADACLSVAAANTLGKALAKAGLPQGENECTAVARNETDACRAKHTPGPWNATVTAGEDGYTREIFSEDAAAGRTYVGYVHMVPVGPKRENPIQEAEANGRLVAAAPALLEACRAAKEVLAKADDFNATMREIGEALAAVDSAISRAEKGFGGS